MITKSYDLTVDLTKKLQQQRIEFVRGDMKSCILNITIKNNDVTVDLTGLNVQFFMLKADGTKVVYDSRYDTSALKIIDASKGITQCTLSTQALTSRGYADAHVSIIDGNIAKASSKSFSIYISDGWDSELVSVNEVPILQKLIQDTDNLQQQVDDAEVLRENTETQRESRFNQAISDFNTAKNNLDGSINTGNVLKTNLDNDIATGNALHTTLQADTQTANTAATAVANAIRAGNYSINILDAAAEGAANIAREACPSGLIKMSTIDFAYSKTNPNKIKLVGGGTALVNGYKVPIADGTIIDIGAPPVAGEREDLVFLEVWKQADANGIISLQSRIRVVQGVDFNKFAEGIPSYNEVNANGWTNLVITPQGGNTNPIVKDTSTIEKQFTTLFIKCNPLWTTGTAIQKQDDTGLFVAGFGTQASKDLLKTADGYVYAIPLFRVKRRNSGGYSVINPNGSRNLYKINLGSKVVRLNDTVTAPMADGYSINDVSVGDYISNSLLSPLIYNAFKYFMVTGVNVATGIITMQALYDFGTSIANFGTAYGLGLNSENKVPPSIVHANIIDDRDIIDLRHLVSLTGFSYQQILEDNWDRLSRNDLQTKERKKMLKTYHGISKTPIDANTIFYASLDGTTTAEVGDTLASKANLGGYGSMPTGMGVSFNSIGANPTNIKIPASNISFPLTSEAWITPKNIPNITGTVQYIFILRNASASKYIAVGIDKATSRLYLIIIGVAGTGVLVSYPNIVDGSTYHVRLVTNTGYVKLYLNGTLVAHSTGTFSTLDYDDGLIIGYPSIGYGFNGIMSDLMISNIDRGATFATLPADFIAGYARIDKAFNGQRKTHSDSLSSQYTTGIAKIGTGSSKGLTVSRSSGNWANGDTVKVTGLAGSIISGVIDSDTAITRMITRTCTAGSPIPVEDVSKLSVNDTVKFYRQEDNYFSMDATITAVDTVNKTISINTWALSDGTWFIIESTASTSSPTVKFMNAGTPTAVAGTWTALGTNEATFTLGTNASLVNADLQIEYSLNMIPGQGGISEVYTATLAGEFKGKKLIPGTIVVRDDLKNKAVGDGNPITVKYAKATSLQLPAAFTQEVANIDYSNMAIQGDNNVYTLSTSVNGEIAQVAIIVDVIKEIEAKYGIIPSIDKVGWVKANVRSVYVRATALGSGPNGNKSTISYFAGGSWATNSAGAINTTSNLTTIVAATNISSSDGTFAALVYSDPSNGTIPSSITIDGISVDIEFSTPAGYDVLVPENPRRDDGAAGILLVRKETKEIQTYFDSYNTDGVVTYGDYVPKQSIPATGLIGGYTITTPKAYVTTITTKNSNMVAAKGIKYDLLDDFSIIDSVISSALADGSQLLNGFTLPAASLVYTQALMQPVNIIGNHTSYKKGGIGKLTITGANVSIDGTPLFCIVDTTVIKNNKCVGLLVALVKGTDGQLYLLLGATSNTSTSGFIGFDNSPTQRVIAYTITNRPLIK